MGAEQEAGGREAVEGVADAADAFEGGDVEGDMVEFFKRLPNADKQFTVMPGISHASFQQKNYRTVYDILNAWFARIDPVYRG